MKKRTLYILAGVGLALAVASSLGLLMLVKTSNTIPNSMISEDDTDIWEIFFSVFGMIYAIIVGLFIVEAHRKLRELSTAVQSELNALGDINDFLRYFEEKDQKIGAVRHVQKALCEYVGNVAQDMDKKQKETASHDKKRREHVTDIIGAISSLEAKPQNHNEKFALEAMIQRVGELTTFRAQKTEIARRGFPWPFYALLLFMTAVTILGFILQSVESEILHGVLVSAIAFSTSVLFLIVWDLDSPLEGHWNIREELVKSVAYIKKNLNCDQFKREPTGSLLD